MRAIAVEIAEAELRGDQARGTLRLSPPATTTYTLRSEAVLLYPSWLRIRASLSPVCELVHHLGESCPIYALALMPTATVPVERASADLKLPDLLIGGVDLEIQRRSGFRQVEVRESGLYLMPTLRAASFSCRHTVFLRG